MLTALVGRHVGLIAPPAELLYAAADARVNRIRAVTGATDTTLGWPADTGGGVAYGSLRSAALAAAVGEALERYGLACLDERRVAYASVADRCRRGDPFVDPADLATFLPGQYEPAGPLPRLDPRRPIAWLLGFDLATGCPVWVPALACAFPRGAHPSGDAHGQAEPAHAEPIWYQPTSNGVAAGATAFGACLAGILELLERDAFMLMWYHRARLPHLEIDPASPVGRDLARRVAPAGLEYRLIDLTDVHSVPIVVAVVRRRVDGRMVYGIGGGAAASRQLASWKAVVEAACVESWTRDRIRSGAAGTLTPEDVTDFEHHLQYYADPRHHDELAFLWETREVRTVGADGPPAPTTEPETALRQVADKLVDRGIAVYAVNLTPEDVAGLDLHVYRILAPRLVPLDCVHEARHLGNRRLYEEPVRLGWRPDTPRLADLNHAPHPYP